MCMEQKREYMRRIMLAINCIDGLYDSIAKKDAGVSYNMLVLLYALDDGQVHTQKSICEEWLIPRTTLNTIIKECEAAGYLTLQSIPGQKRELRICLTETGKAFAREKLAPFYQAEDLAITKTLQECRPEFITELEIFGRHLQQAFRQHLS